MQANSSLCPVCGQQVSARAAAGLCPSCLAMNMMLPASDTSAGTERLGSYELLEVIGHGGMGTVWRARQLGVPDVTREVALKAVAAARALHTGVERRFRAEISVVLRLEHPAIVPVYDAGVADEQLFFTMKLLTGGTLQEQPRQSPQTIARTMLRVARAVAYAHERGVLHRDLKPANILLDEAGLPYVADFGLARLLEDSPGSEALTRSRDIVGTPAFMAPEQAVGGGTLLTTAVDVFGLGSVLYFLLSGQAPAQGSSHAEILRAVSEQEPARPSSLHGDVPRDLEIIALKCLEKKPAARYASADALADDLERWLAGEPIQARPPTALERLRSWSRRHRVQAALWPVAALFAAVVGLLVWEHNAALEAERDAANAAVRRTDLELYASSMTLAWRAWAENDFAGTARYLEETRPAQRDFSWQALKAEMNLSLSDPICTQVLRDVPGPPLALAYAAEAKRLFLAGHERLVWCEPGDGTARPEFHVVLSDVSFLENAQAGFAQQLLESSVPPPWPEEWGSNGSQVDLDVADKLMARLLGLKGWAPHLHARSRPAMIGTRPGLAVSVDGKRLVVAPENGFARIWNLAGPLPIPESLLPLHAGVVSMSRDGLRVAAAPARGEEKWKSNWGPICLWQHKDSTLPPPTSFAIPGRWSTVALSPDGGRLFMADQHWGVNLMEFDTGRSLLDGNNWQFRDGLSALAFTPDNRGVAMARDVNRDGMAFSLAVLKPDDESRRYARWLPTTPAATTQFSYSLDGLYLARASAAPSIHVDVGGAPPVILNGHTDSVTSVAFTGERTLASASADGTVRFWDIAKKIGGHAPKLEAPGKLIYPTILWSPDEKWIGWNNRERTLYLTDTETGLKTDFTTVAEGETATFCGWTDAGRQTVISVAPANADKGKARLEVHRFGSDGRSGGVLRLLPLPCAGDELIIAQSISPDGRWWSAGYHVEPGTWFLDLKAPAPEAFLVRGYSGDHCQWSPDSKLFAVNSATGNSLVVFSPPERRLTGQFRLAGGNDSIASFGWLPDSRTLLVAHQQDVLVVDAATGSVKHRYTGLRFPLTAVAASPDGQTMLTLADRFAFWHLPTGRLIGTFPVIGWVLSFSPSGRQAVTEESSTKLRLWGVSRLISPAAKSNDPSVK